MERCSDKADFATPKSGQSMIDSINWLLRAILWPEDLRQLFALQFYFFFARTLSARNVELMQPVCGCAAPRTTDWILNYLIWFIYISCSLSPAFSMGHASIWIPRRWIGVGLGSGRAKDRSDLTEKGKVALFENDPPKTSRVEKNPNIKYPKVAIHCKHWVGGAGHCSTSDIFARIFSDRPKRTVCGGIGCLEVYWFFWN